MAQSLQYKLRMKDVRGQSSLEYLVAITVLVFGMIAIWSTPSVIQAIAGMRTSIVQTVAEDAVRQP